MSRICICALLASAVLLPRAAAGGPPRVRGVQGVDDDGMTHAALAVPDGGATLRARYATLETHLAPGVRRYVHVYIPALRVRHHC